MKLKNKNTKIKKAILCLFVAGIFGAVALLPQGFLDNQAYASVTQADLNNIRDQINKVKDKIAGYESEANRLASEANTLSNQIEILKAEENLLLSQIEMSQAEHDEKVAEIEATQKRIDDNSETMGYIIAQYYYNEKISTIERLASSENLASFIDEEASLSGLSDSISEIVDTNKNLKEEQEAARLELERLLEDMQSRQAALESKRAEQQSLWSQTKGMEQEYQTMKASASSEKEKLEAEQARLLQQWAAQNNSSGMTAGDPSKGGYPYSGSCPSAKLNGTQYGDKWGMYICECVSYTAWKVQQNYGNMPYWGGKGNANLWLKNAKAAGIPTGILPKVGSVGVSLSGPYGHVVWVEAINEAGTRIYVSQYNDSGNGYRGQYSEMWINASAFNGFIYFGQR